jgi:hypothetical protein
VVALTLGRALLRPRGDERRDGLRALAVGLLLLTLATAVPLVGSLVWLGLSRGGGAGPGARLAGRRRAKLGGMTIEIRTAAEILTAERTAEWIARRAQRDDAVLRAIWREFVRRRGPVPLPRVAAALPDLAMDALRARIAALDAADLIGLGAGEVRLAYPFTADPTPFEVVLPPGAEPRCACCAIDALGVAPMLGTPVEVRSRCHWSGASLAFAVDPVTGPRGAPPGCLAWVERGRWGGDRRSGSL